MSLTWVSPAVSSAAFDMLSPCPFASPWPCAWTLFGRDVESLPRFLGLLILRDCLLNSAVLGDAATVDHLCNSSSEINAAAPAVLATFPSSTQDRSDTAEPDGRASGVSPGNASSDFDESDNLEELDD